jgi:hypothetical protein
MRSKTIIADVTFKEIHKIPDNRTTPNLYIPTDHPLTVNVQLLL